MARRPVLIVPGFCSTRLEVEKSEVCPSWKGQRIWLGLSNIGFSAMHGKGTWEDPTALSLKNQWLQHLVLAGPEEETKGIALKAVPGLEGVKSLDPESFMGLAAEASYVFAPVIRFLEQLGYAEGKDLVAAGYDWRFPPSVLEKRDGYFSQLILTIEGLYQRQKQGVVLLAHSMGNKVVSYFLNFAKAKKGIAWLDQHIHQWIAAGAPHAGAPQALRSTIFGDKFGLDHFVTDSEARAFARSLSAACWLFPTGKETTPFFHLRRGGVLEVKEVSATVGAAGITSVKNKVMVTLEVHWGSQTEILTTKSASSFDGKKAIFDEANNFLQFAGPEEMPGSASIKAIIKEKGIGHDTNDGWFSRVGQGIAAGVMLVEEAARGRKGLGVPRAFTEAMSLRSLLDSSPADKDGFIEVCLPVVKLASGPVSALGYGKTVDFGDKVTLRMRWLSFAGMKKAWLGSETLWQGDAPPYRFTGPGKSSYDPVGVREVLRIEGCESIVDTWKSYYAEDPLYDDLRQLQPPVRKLRAIHGVNVPTEVAYALRVQTIRLKHSQILTRLVLDNEATAQLEGCTLRGGILSSSSGKLSGDGVVDLQSLDEYRGWEVDWELTYLPGVEHRAMLADGHFHQAIKEAVCEAPPKQPAPGMQFFIAGTFSSWKADEMTWDGSGFVYVLTIGSNGWESFQLLLDGSWQKVYYPSMKDASPEVAHSIQGPDNQNAGKDWTIGKNRGKLLEGSLRPGSAFRVRLEMEGARPRLVSWEPFVQVQARRGTWQVWNRSGWQKLPQEVQQSLAQGQTEVSWNAERCRADLLNMRLQSLGSKEQWPLRRA